MSKSVSRLERKLGVKLLERSTREVHPTVEGEVLLEHGRRALGEVEAARVRLSHAREGVEGIVRVEAWPYLGQAIIAPALPALLRRHPGLIVHLSLREQPRAPGERGVDLTVYTAAPRNEDLVVLKAGTLSGRALLCASPAYLTSAGHPRTPDELRVHACLGFIVDEQVQPWVFSTPDGPVQIAPRSSFAATNKEVLIEAAVRGLGIVRVADRMVTALLKAGALETVLDGLEVVERQAVFVARSGGRLMPRRTRLVFQFLLDLFTKEGG